MKTRIRIDYTDKYKNAVHFKNNKLPKHRWYPFVEGYSPDFINSILDEYQSNNGNKPNLCADPFAGSGTTALELQNHNIKCHTFEVNPFMHLLATTKLTIGYRSEDIINFINLCKVHFNENHYIPPEEYTFSTFKTFVEDGIKKKYNFNLDVYKGIIDVKKCIAAYSNENYSNLYSVALSSILIKVSNVYRNGKCVSYKDNWAELNLNRKSVHIEFLNVLENIILPDVRCFETSESNFSNKELCHYGSVFSNFDDKIMDNSVDLIITSPPYLNSRDYTDTYMLEIKALDFYNNTKEILNLRKKTMRSHVQVNWEDVNYKKIERLNSAINQMMLKEDEFWNKQLPNMIKGYFQDIDHLFSLFSKKLKVGAYIYFNIANSAYYNILFETDFICTDIAETYGFETIEIRTARLINPSAQQKKIGKLHECVIVFKKAEN